MGVTGLWRLIEPAGKPVPVETLENKVLAVDISIWLHQMVKGYQDAKGAPLPNAHLIGLFQRLCKLLYFRIKPVFVFDGAFPELKKETIAKRQDNKQKFNSESERLKRELAVLLSKKSAISSLLGKQITPPKKSNPPGQDDDLFKLPDLPQREESESESEDENSSSSSSIVDLHSVDVESDSFKKMPVKEKYDLLLELKETRKMNSWGKLNELPKKSDNFSDFQMQRLLKRRKVQECLEETEKEMGDSGMSMNELESLLNEEGIDTKIETLPTRRIASNNTTRFVLINDVKQALADAKKKKEADDKASAMNIDEKKPYTEVATLVKRDELEDDLEKAIQMSLECANEADTSPCLSKTDDSWTTYVTETDYSDSEEEDGFDPPDMSSAKAYIMQYCDFTNKAIDDIIVNRNKGNKIKRKKPKVNQIIEEINKDKSVIIDKMELSSSDDDCIQESIDSDRKTSKICEVETNNLDSPDKTMDTTQSSVVCVENHGDDVMTLNSDAEESPDKSTILNETTEYMNKEKLDVSDVNIDATQASVIFVGTQAHDVVTLDSDSEESPKKTENSLKLKECLHDDVEYKDSSDSSDVDFEDVPEIEATKNKTVVELDLNVNDNTVEDDIFADVFVNRQEKKCGLKIQDVAMIPEITAMIDVDDEDELQRAIKMSLECVTEIEKEFDKVQPQGEKINQESISKNVVSDNHNNPNEHLSQKGKSKISLTQESLKAIQSVQTLKPAINIELDSNKVTITKDSNNQPKEQISRENLNDMVQEIQQEEQEIIKEKGRLDRVGRNITEQMTKEAQELLQLFGIPYIVAPMEAEAQCAFLENVKLTDGTITDDSDIWLFGGRTVYKNFFNQKKHVLQFLAERVETSFNLNREQLILLALLVGSDYTTGVAGVGPVTALEILASFPVNKRKLLKEMSKQERYAEIIAGLQEFKKWVRSGKRTDNTSLKKKLRNVALTDDFPSVRVVQAYLEPNIEKSEEKFTWGELDITILRDYTKAKFGWSQHKLDEIINPVLKRLTERKSQKTVHDYFKRKVDFQSLEDQMSKRVKAAVQKMGPELPIEEKLLAELEGDLKPERKRKVTKGKDDAAKAGPSTAKHKKTDAEVLKNQSVRIVSETKEGKSGIEINIPKTDRFQEIIPQREKDKQSLLQNKLKAIELFRKTNIDKKKKTTKRKALQPKPEAELSESSDSN